MNRPLTPVDLIRRAFRVYPERVALIDGDDTLSYAGLAERTARLAHALRGAGVGPGDHVALLAPNTRHALLAFHAVPWLGATLVPLNVRLTSEEYAFVLWHADVKLALVDAALLPNVEATLARLGVPCWLLGPHGDLDGRLAGSEPEPLVIPDDLDENDVITINYTSGTTSDPKGVMLTHRSTALSALNLMYHLDLRPGSVYLHSLPLPHVNGWAGVWAVTGAGGTHVTLSDASGGQIEAAVTRHAVTHLSATPAQLGAFADPLTSRPLPRRVRVLLAGSPPGARLIGNLERLGFDVAHAYGLTEASPLVTLAEDTPETRALPAAERAELLARQGYEMIVAGEVDVVTEDGRPVPRDGRTIGEIVVRGSLVMKGYYKNDPATRQAIRDGWLHTRDFACVQPDGRIEIRDRATDVIITGGERMSSIEVEAALHRHPSIREVVVVSGPDARLGEVPVAFVVLHDGARLDPDDLIAFARGLLAGFKVPARVETLPELPKTANGKVRKNVLRARAWAGHARPIG